MDEVLSSTVENMVISWIRSVIPWLVILTPFMCDGGLGLDSIPYTALNITPVGGGKSGGDVNVVAPAHCHTCNKLLL